jgi:ArsR family transcriptional regulator, arsenate/arsenite/antimonite-responsive transcriptional repressor
MIADERIVALHRQLSICSLDSVPEVAMTTTSAKRPAPQPIEACCSVITGAPLEAEHAERLAEAFGVLADPARLRLLALLAAQPDGEACVCELTAPLGLSQPTVSHHLRLLHSAGFVSRERRGTYSYYRVEAAPFGVLRDALDTRLAG